MANTENKAIPFGMHLIFDAYECDFDKINNMESCYTLLDTLAKKTSMKKLMEPILIKALGNDKFGGKDPGGFTGVLIIEESHISIHTFAKRGFATIDVYSCKKFDSNKVISYLKSYLNPKDFDTYITERGLKYPMNNIYN